MTTTAQLLDRVRQKTNKRDSINKLNGAITSTTATTFVYEHATNPPSEGGRVSIDLEDLHVWSVDTGTKTATVERGVNSTTPATHLDDALIVVGATYSPFEILTAVNDELAALPGLGVARHAEVTLTAGTVTGYDLAGVTNLLRVRKVSWFDTVANNYRPINRRYWRVDQDVPAADFPSGYGLFISDPYMTNGADLQVAYTTTFTALTSLAQVVESVAFLPSRAVSLVAVGAALRLTSGAAIARTRMRAQGDTRRAEEVSTSDTRLAQSPLLLEYQRLLDGERRAQGQEHR